MSIDNLYTIYSIQTSKNVSNVNKTILANYSLVLYITHVDTTKFNSTYLNPLSFPNFPTNLTKSINNFQVYLITKYTHTLHHQRPSFKILR